MSMKIKVTKSMSDNKTFVAPSNNGENCPISRVFDIIIPITPSNSDECSLLDIIKFVGITVSVILFSILLS